MYQGINKIKWNALNISICFVASYVDRIVLYRLHCEPLFGFPIIRSVSGRHFAIRTIFHKECLKPRFLSLLAGLLLSGAAVKEHVVFFRIRTPVSLSYV